MNPHNNTSGDQVDKQEEWLQEAIGDLQEPLPLETRSALRRARAEALEQLPSENMGHWLLPQWGIAAMASVAVMVVAWTLFNNPGINDSPAAHTVTLAQADLAIINAPDDLEFYRDLELMQWLETEGSSKQHGS